MFGLLKTLLFTAALRQGAGDAKRRLQRAVVLGAVALGGGLLFVVGLGFLIAAGHDALVAATDERTANLICGAAFLVIGGITIAVSRTDIGARRPVAGLTRPDMRPEIRAEIPANAAILGREVEALLSRHVGTVATSAFVAGLLLAIRRR